MVDINQQQRVTTKGDTSCFPLTDKTVDRKSLGPIQASATSPNFFHF